ncbi:transcription factor [Aquamicrobium segne]|uniref:Transcription factor n=1 Tax=Aquamicrobium segne TaxID=469547 RepID=A0ABW0H3F3_9HYPH
MPTKDVFKMIRDAIDTAPRNGYVAELHLQVLKYADDLEGTSGKDFCAALDLNKSWGTEFAKMKKISGRLRDAGLDPAKI